MQIPEQFHRTFLMTIGAVVASIFILVKLKRINWLPWVLGFVNAGSMILLPSPLNELDDIGLKWTIIGGSTIGVIVALVLIIRVPAVKSFLSRWE